MTFEQFTERVFKGLKADLTKTTKKYSELTPEELEQVHEYAELDRGDLQVEAQDGFIPIQFDIPVDNFILTGDCKSLVGCPTQVDQEFNCQGNKLTSLSGAEEVSCHTFTCADNPELKLDYKPKEIKYIMRFKNTKITLQEVLKAYPKMAQNYLDIFDSWSSGRGTPKIDGDKFRIEISLEDALEAFYRGGRNDPDKQKLIDIISGDNDFDYFDYGLDFNDMLEYLNGDIKDKFKQKCIDIGMDEDDDIGDFVSEHDELREILDIAFSSHFYSAMDNYYKKNISLEENLHYIDPENISEGLYYNMTVWDFFSSEEDGDYYFDESDEPEIAFSARGDWYTYFDDKAYNKEVEEAL